jgi:hypothetical protein
MLGQAMIRWIFKRWWQWRVDVNVARAVEMEKHARLLTTRLKGPAIGVSETRRMAAHLARADFYQQRLDLLRERNEKAPKDITPEQGVER